MLEVIIRTGEMLTNREEKTSKNTEEVGQFACALLHTMAHILLIRYARVAANQNRVE